MPNLTQQKSQNKREEKQNEPYNRTFDVSAADQLRRTHGIQNLHGADAAVLSTFHGAPAANTTLGYQEEGMAETTRAADTDTGIAGFFGKLFSRRVSFSVNGTPIEGKNGHQVRGNTVPLMQGAMLDIAPATLTGHYESKTNQSATGDGAYLYMAPVGAKSVVQQKMNNVTLKSDQTIQAQSAQAAVLPIGGLKISLNETKVLQAPEGASASMAAVYLPSVSIESADGSMESVRSADMMLQGGVATIAQMGFVVKGEQISDTAVYLKQVTLGEDGLRFHAGAFQYTLDGQSGSFALPGNLLSIRSLRQEVQTAKNQLHEKLAQGQTPAQPATHAAASTTPVPDAHTAPVPPEQIKEDPTRWLLPESIENGQIALTQTAAHFAQKGEYTATVALDTHIVTSGARAIDLDGATFTQEDVKLSVRDGKVSGKIGDGTLEGKAKYANGAKKEGWGLALRDVAIVDNKLVAGQLYIEQSLGDGLALGADDNQSLTDAQSAVTDSVGFGIGMPPRRSLFQGVTLSGGQYLNATFEKNASPVFSISKDPFEIEIDFDQNTFHATYQKDSSFIPEKHESYPLAAVPLIPGLLAFTMSLEPLCGMEGSFSVSAELGEDLFKRGTESDFSLGGAGSFNFEIGAAVSAAIEAGATGLLTVYAALNAALKAQIEAGLEAGVKVKKTKEGALNFDKLDLSGEVQAALEGSIGGSLGVRFLIYKSDLVQYTFKTWKLAQMGLSAAVSKDASKGITNGWSLEKSSFSASAFGKKFTSHNSKEDKYGIKGSSAQIGKSLLLQEGFAKLKEEIDQITSNFAVLQKALQEASADANNPSAVVVDMDFLNEQAALLLAFYAKLSEQSVQMKQAQEELAVRLPVLEKQLVKETKSKGADIKKHQDRLAYFGMVEQVLAKDKTKTMDYPTAKKKAAAQWETKEVQREATKQNVFAQVKQHEEKQCETYKNAADSAKTTRGQAQSTASFNKHVARLKQLSDLEAQYDHKPALLNQKVLTLYDSELLAELKTKVYAGVKTMKKEDTYSKGYQRANETATPIKRSEDAHTRALEYTQSHIAYEQTRAEYYSIDRLKEELVQLRSAMQKNEALIPQYKEMETVFATGSTLSGGSVQKDQSNEQLSKMLQYLRGAENINKIQEQLEQTQKSAATQQKCQAYLTAVTTQLEAPAQAELATAQQALTSEEEQ